MTFEPRPSFAARMQQWLGSPWPLVLLVLLMVPIANTRVAATDEVQYYVYLPSLRFDQDLNFANDYQRMAQLNPKAGIEQSLLNFDRIRKNTGLYGNIAPVGSALLWSPFFLLADLFVTIANGFGAAIPADGYSKPYIAAVCYGSMIYGFVGLLLCRKLALRFASPRAATMATIGMWLATPLVFYMLVQMAFSHANGFFLVSLFIYLWHSTRPVAGQGRSLGAWAALGVVGGLMTITREQLGLFMLLPAIESLLRYGAILRGALGPRVAAFFTLFTKHIVFVLLFILALLPQLATYQVLNGAPRPAGEVSGKLNWCSPHMLDTLIDFDPRPAPRCNVVGDPVDRKPEQYPPFAHGALVWNPILVFGLLGLPLLWRRDRLLALVFPLLFLAQVYLNGAFGSTWHLTGSFGFRRLIECTPIMIVGLALLLDWLHPRLGRLAFVPTLLILALIAWNSGLILNWTVFNTITNLREGMRWPQLWRWQAEVPGRLLSTINDVLFNRCKLMENGRC